MASRGWITAAASGTALLLGCVEPGVNPEKARAFERETLAFLQDGKTTRQEVLLKLGTPLARFEGDRILTYDFVLAAGTWQRVGAASVGEWGFPVASGSCSVVLVFDGEGILSKHSFVRLERKPTLPVEETTASGSQPAS